MNNRALSTARLTVLVVLAALDVFQGHLIRQRTEALRGCNDRYEEQAARAEQWRGNSYKCKDILQATVKRVSQCYEVCDGPVDRSPVCSGDFCFTPPARKVSQ